MRGPLLFICLVCAGVARAQGDEPRRPEERLDIGALPMPNYDSNFGFGMGLNVGLFFRKPGYEPYQHAIRFQVYGATGGYQEHYVSSDSPNLAGTPYRLITRLAYVRDRFRPYYGTGNDTQVLPVSDPRWGQHYYEIDDSYFQLDLNGQRFVSGRWKVGLRYALFYGMTRRYSGSLADQNPNAMGDGLEGMVLGEAQYDGRDAEASPTRGIFASVQVYGSHPFLLSSYTYAGAQGRLAGYWSPFNSPYLVIAARVMGDWLTSGAPVRHELGLGGDSTVRGVPRERYVGNVRLVGNLELRSRAARFRPWDHELDAWIVAFGDVGQIWAEAGQNGPPWLVHAGYGLGLRLAWEADYVVRFDVSYSPDQPLGIFLVFNHPF